MLAIGLLATGLGTVPFMRWSLESNLDQSLVQLAQTPVSERNFDLSAGEDGELVIEPRDAGARSDMYIALYSSEGSLIARTGERTLGPRFPSVFSLTKAYISQLEPFTLDGVARGTTFRGIVNVVTLPGSTQLYTQLIAMPLASIDKSLQQYMGIFATLAVLAVSGGALVTRWVVTLAFRRLRRVEATAMTIAAGDFSQRLDNDEPTTEVGRLKIALNTMLDRVDASIAQRDATVQQMRRFVGDASHELRTPLVTMRGYAELYRIGAIKGDEATAQAMERIEKEAIRMGRMVEDLLALARLDEKREVEIVPVDLRLVAKDGAMDVMAAAPQRTVTVIDTTGETPSASAPSISRDGADAPEPQETPAARKRGMGRAGATLSRLRRRRPGAALPGAPGGEPLTDVLSLHELESAATAPLIAPVVLAEEDKIRQVVTNLLGNAQRFTDADSPIEIAVGVDARRSLGWIRVIDHGEGIPPQQREQIFQRFWRADTSRARETGGSGLGLAIVAGIVDSLGGRVSVDETPGGGASFTVALPLAPTAFPRR